MSPVPAIQSQPSADLGALALEQVATVSLKKSPKSANQISKSVSNKEEQPSNELDGQRSEPKAASKNKVWIRYTAAELLALSKSPLCQPPNPMPVLDGKKANHRGGRQNQNNSGAIDPSAANAQGSNKTISGSNTPASRKISLQASQLNLQGAHKQRTQGSKSSSVFQFKGRKGEDEVNGSKQRTTETGNSKYQISQTQDSQRSQNPANSKRAGGSGSQVPEWMGQDAPPDPIQQANQQQNFANWKEQQKLKDASRLPPAKDLPAPSPPVTDSSRFRKYFNKASLDSIEVSLNSMDLKAEVASEPIVEGQNLDFILKALQEDAPIKKSNGALAPEGVDPAIVSLQDPSTFFNPPQSRPQHNHYSPSQRSEVSFQSDPFFMNVPSGNIPTAVLKQLSNKAPSVNLRETSVNLASFLESRDRHHRASPALPSNHNFMGAPGPSFNYTPHPYGFNANPHYQHAPPPSQSISLDDLFASHRHTSVPSQPSYIDPKFASWTSAPANPPFFSSSHHYDYNQRPQ